MLARLILLALLLTQIAGAQNVYRLQVGSWFMPDYESILMPKESRGSLRGIDDLKPAERYSATNRIDGIFADITRERTNGFYVSCLAEVPLMNLSLHCPGKLLGAEQVRALLRDAVAIPRAVWTKHVSNAPGRYVFCLKGPKDREYVIDLRSGAFALVFYPDNTYRCVVGPGYTFLPPLQQHHAADADQPFSSVTNREPSAAGSHR